MMLLHLTPETSLTLFLAVVLTCLGLLTIAAYTLWRGNGVSFDATD
jgi:hypothetical protein